MREREREGEWGGGGGEGEVAHIWLHLSKHAVSVVPDAEEAEYMSIHLQKLLEVVIGGGSGVGVGGEMARESVGVCGQVRWRRQLNPLTHHEVLGHVRVM